jgi:signal transduction histidine kinase
MFTGTFYPFMGFVMITSALMLWVIIRAWMRGRAYAPGFAIGIAIAVGGAVNDMLYVADIIETGYVSHLTLFIYLLIYSIIFSRKSNHLYLRTAALSAEVTSVNENLEYLVDDRTRELNETSELLRKQRGELQESNAQLKKIVDVKNKIFTVIGHDIRGPVGVTHQMIEALLHEDIPEDERKQMLTLLAGSTSSVMNLLENLLAWGRAQTGSLLAKPERFALISVIRETAEIFNLTIIEKNLKLIVTVADDIEVYADPEHVKLVMRNLFSNAIKFTKHGGSIRVTAGFTGDNKIIEISVSDTGIGIPTVVLGKLFSEGEHHSTFGTGKEKGSGIGLKLCREVLELNHGWIRVRSKTGEGSEFIVGLPADGPSPAR